MNAKNVCTGPRNQDYTFRTLDEAVAELKNRITHEGKSVAWQHTTPQIEQLPDGTWRLRLIRSWTYRHARAVDGSRSNVSM